MATDTSVSEIIRWLIDNRLIRFTNFSTKFGDPIPFDFRIDRSCLNSYMNSIGEKLADRVIEIEKDLNLEFDSMFCSLFSGVFSGISTSLWLEKKYNRKIKIAISRRSYNQELGANAWSIHPLKNKNLVGELGKNVLIHDEMTNTGNTIRDLIATSCEQSIEPKAIMIIADRILDPLPKDTHIRIIEKIPCYSLITHYEIIDWCNENQEIWKSLFEK